MVGEVLRKQEGACHQCPSKVYVDKASCEVYELSLDLCAILSSLLALPFENPLPLRPCLSASLSHSVLPSFQGCMILICISTIPLHSNKNLSMAQGTLFSAFCPIREQVK